jgi:hypothetical protein
MKNYPAEHKDIVYQLINGKFILYPNPLFIAIQKQDDEYKEFFKASFGYDLIIENEYAYLTSSETHEKKTRDFTLFLAILCRELDYAGKNFKEVIELSTFDTFETEQLLRASSKWEILERTSVANFESFIDAWHRKDVLERNGNKFKFTKAVRVFFEFAVNIANAKLRQQHDLHLQDQKTVKLVQEEV